MNKLSPSPPICIFFFSNEFEFNLIQFQIQGACNWIGVCYKWILQQSPRPMHFLINQAHPIIISSKASNKFRVHMTKLNVAKGYVN
jgi:hypothetical protein